MLDFFGTAWDDVDERVVEDFLAHAGDEGLVWEAKGCERPNPDSVRKAVAGFANSAGGFLIIGADRVAESWKLHGLDFQVDEPGTWLTSVITTGLQPVPRFDVKIMARGAGLNAAVVAVTPLAVPPCMTSSGVVYQRVSGQTLPVVDQRVLSDLVGRGEGARRAAELMAERAARRALQAPGILAPEYGLIGIALTPVQGTDDKSALLFSPSFVNRFKKRAFAALQVDPMLGYSTSVAVQQDCVRVFPNSRELDASWLAAAFWDGSVSAVFATQETEVHLSELLPRLRQVWDLLVELVLDLGGTGQAHLTSLFNREHQAFVDQDVVPIWPIRRWTELSKPADTEFAMFEREMRRSFGKPALEPDGSN